MRIISGTKRGLKLLPPKTNDTRPITDRVKESLFSILYKYDIVPDARVADLFCGTGSTGLEALSRGANSCVFVELSRPTAVICQKNIDRADFSEQATILKADAFRSGAPMGIESDKYDLVFVDPPYKMAFDTEQGSQLGKLLIMISEQVTDNAIVSVRTSSRSVLQETYAGLRVIDRRTWGNMAVTLLQPEPKNAH